MVLVSHSYGRLARWAARAAADKKAVDIQVLDIRSESDVADYVVIAGAMSSVQLRTVRMAVVEALERRGFSPLHQDGRSAERWTALDYGGLVVHVLLPEARAFYRLEKMWEKPKIVSWKSK